MGSYCTCIVKVSILCISPVAKEKMLALHVSENHRHVKCGGIQAEPPLPKVLNPEPSES